MNYQHFKQPHLLQMTLQPRLLIVDRLAIRQTTAAQQIVVARLDIGETGVNHAKRGQSSNAHGSAVAPKTAGHIAHDPRVHRRSERSDAGTLRHHRGRLVDGRAVPRQQMAHPGVTPIVAARRFAMATGHRRHEEHTNWAFV